MPTVQRMLGYSNIMDSFRYHTSNQQQRFQITPRDIRILEMAASLRFVRTSQILALFGGGSKIPRRLRLLFETGYLVRFKCPSPRRGLGGSSEIVHGLGKKGAKLLAARGTLEFGRLDWLQRHSKNESIEHALMISSFLTELELSCRNYEHIRFISPFEAKGIILGQPKHLAWKIQTSFKGTTHNIGIVPDEVFGLQMERQEPIYFFFEADRGTVPISSRNMFRTSMAKKLVGYQATMESRLLRDKWDLPFFKVITLTSSRKRMEHLLKVANQFNHGRGSGLFLFVDQESFSNSDDILMTEFVSGFNHEGVRLDGLNHSWSRSNRTKQSSPLPLQWN